MKPEQLSFDEQFKRILHVTGARTHFELAQYFEISQTRITDAKRRGKIPAEWLLVVLKSQNVSPEWIQTGLGPKYLTTVKGIYESPEEVEERQNMTESLKTMSSRMLAEELLRRLAVYQSS